MKIIVGAAAAVGLLLTIVPAILVTAGQLEWHTHAHLMAAGMVVWFVAATWQSKLMKKA